MSNYAMRKDDDTKPRVSLEKSGITDDNALRNSYAMSTQCVTSNTKTAACVHCGKQYERRTTWQKYCTELCKIQAYELRTGKQWRVK